MSLPIHRCAHWGCNTTVTDWNAVTCEHLVTICEWCVIEEACEACDLAAGDGAA